MSILADQHIHSHHSGDSDESMERIADSAIAAGLKYLCFTEHMDFDYPPVDDPELTPDTFILDADPYKAEYLRIRDRYAGRIELMLGTEIGMQPHVAIENRDFCRSLEPDLVVASIHVVKRRDPYYPSFYEGRSEEEAVAETLEETLENIRLFEDFDVLGHMDYIIRYLPSRRKTVDMSAFSPVVDEILKLLIRRGQGLDLNTAPLTRGFPHMHPSHYILERYRDLGGRVITFGSDAHKCENVASCFDTAEKEARDCGFEEYCVFRSRKPEFIRF
ncbi:MAG: histidinol-phosphatase HisJ family protein [Lachnospiraceae bacterium]|nr:histidinol-phosphatase HisJ family protein [Lachnospiraceae bacterium]